jgi:hypothetical protein
MDMLVSMLSLQDEPGKRCCCPGREEITLTRGPTAPLEAQAIDTPIKGNLSPQRVRKAVYKEVLVPSHPILFSSSSSQQHQQTAPHPVQPNIIIIRLQPSILSATHSQQHSLLIIS